jgi:hypothetical protein
MYPINRNHSLNSIFHRIIHSIVIALLMSSSYIMANMPSLQELIELDAELARVSRQKKIDDVKNTSLPNNNTSKNTESTLPSQKSNVNNGVTPLNGIAPISVFEEPPVLVYGIYGVEKDLKAMLLYKGVLINAQRGDKRQFDGWRILDIAPEGVTVVKSRNKNKIEQRVLGVLATDLKIANPNVDTSNANASINNAGQNNANNRTNNVPPLPSGSPFK